MTRRPKTLGDRCREAREKLGISQDEAAFRLREILPPGRRPGSGSIIGRIESGIIKRPEPYVIAALAKVYGVHMTDLDPIMAAEAAQILIVLTECAPWESNPEPADSLLCAA
jgi:transcriptional regulator with XRE-family HTH domain